MSTYPLEIMNDHKRGLYPGTPISGTWKINSEVTGVGVRLLCNKSGTFNAFSQTVNTFAGLPNVLPSGDVSGCGVGFFTEISAGFAAGEIEVLARSNDTGASSSNVTTEAGSIIVSNVSNISDYEVGDFVQISNGFPSPTYPYLVTSLSEAGRYLVLSGAANTTVTNATITQCRGIKLSANATSNTSGSTLQTTDPTFTVE